MKKSILLPVIILFFLIYNKSNASHIAAIDLNYTCIGSSQYKISLRIYRDCNGINLPSSMLLIYGSDNCGVSGVLTVNRDTIKEVSQICDSLLYSTTCGSGSFPGMEEHIYSAVLNLPSNCSDWIISFKKCCRNNAITNLLSNNYNLYTFVRINNLVSSCNNSPIFSDIPVLYGCVNQAINFNNGIVDPDGDSLSYQLVNPLTDSNTKIPYSLGSGYSPSIPFTTTTGFIFDSITGQMTFISPSIQQTVVSVLITEYDRAGNIKGTIMRDIQFIIFSCPSVPSTKISGVNYDSINYTYTACFGDTINFNVFSKTMDTTNPVQINFNNSLSGATFTSYINKDTTIGNFSWFPGATSGTYYFTLSSEIDICPIKRKSVFVYTVNIDSVPEVCMDTVVCLDSTGVYNIDSSYVSTLPSGKCGFRTVKVSKTRFDTTNLGANYVDVFTTYSNGYVDTCKALVYVKTIYPNGTICNDTTIYLSSNGNLVIDSSYFNSQGYDLGSTVIVGRDTVDCYDVGTTFISFVVIDSNGNSTMCFTQFKVKDTLKPTANCKDTTVYLDSTGKYIINPSYVDNGSYDNCGVIRMWVSKDTFDCSDIGENEIVLFVVDSSGNIDSCRANVTVINYLGTKANCVDTIIYLDSNGLFVIDSSFVTNRNYHICFPLQIKISKDSFRCKDIGVSLVRVYVTDIYGNMDSCDALVTVLDTIKYKVDAGKDTALCSQTTFLLNATSNSAQFNGYWSYLGPSGSVSFSAVQNKVSLVSNLGIGDNYLIWNESNGSGCLILSDTLLVQVKKKEIAHAGNDVNLCGKYSIQLSGDSLVNGSTGSWRYLPGVPRLPFFTDANNPKSVVYNLIQGQYKLEWSYGNNVCGFSKDTAIINIYDSSFADAGPDQTLCNVNSTILNGNSISNFSSGKWSFAGIATRTPTIINSSSNNSSVLNLQQRTYQFGWTVKNGVCPAVSDTVMVKIHKAPVANAGVDQVVCGKTTVRLNGDSATYPMNVKWVIDSTFLYPSFPVFSNDSASDPVVSNLTDGSYKFIRVVSNGFCPISRDTVMIYVHFKPIVDAGNDFEICETSSFNLSAIAVSSGQVGTWSLDYSYSNPSLVNFGNVNSNITSVSNLVPGFYKFIWNVTSGICYSINDTVVVEVVEKPNANLGPDVKLCGELNYLILPVGNSPITTFSWTNYYNSNNIPSASVSSDSLVVGSMLAGSTYGFSYEIQHRMCPVSKDSILIINNHKPIADFDANKYKFCLNDSVQFFNLSQISSNDSIVSNHWIIANSSFSINNPLINFKTRGVFDVSLEVISNNGCRDTLLKKDFIQTYENPVAGFGYTLSNESGLSVSNNLKIVDQSQWAQHYSYYFDNGDSSFFHSPTHNFQFIDKEYYHVMQIVSNDFGCIDTMVQLVKVPYYTFFIPNSFTPNNDGRNEIFKPIFSEEVFSYNFNIFNRWGELIYSSNTIGEGWNGRYKGNLCKLDVYVWSLKVKSTRDLVEQEYRGHVNLLR